MPGEPKTGAAVKAAAPSPEERAEAKAMARLAASLALITGTGAEITEMRREAAARLSEHDRERHAYDPAYCDIVRDCGALGMHQAEWAVAIGCSETAMWQWGQAHAEFLDALDEAKTLAKAFWERLGRKGIAAAGFNTHLWAIIMRAKWRTSPDGKPEYGDAPAGAVDAPPVEAPQDDDALKAQIAGLQAKLSHRPWVGAKKA